MPFLNSSVNILLFLLVSCIILFGFSCSFNSDNKPSLTSIPFDPQPYNFLVPEKFPQFEIPDSNMLTVAGVDLGRRLFFDPILSLDSTISCSSCHNPKFSFTDQKPVSIGIHGRKGKRSAMNLMNVLFYEKGLFWDGRVNTLEEQALIPVEDTIEMMESWPQVEHKLRAHQKYPVYFRKAFGIEKVQEITKELVIKALAQFERTLISCGNSRYDRFKRGEVKFTEDEIIGHDLFFDISLDIKDAECGNCHNAPLFTSNDYANNGLDSVIGFEGFKDLGLGAISKNKYNNGQFRIPTLRNITLTGPYMHDGRFQTLEEVINHYNKGGNPSGNVHSLIRPLGLTQKEKDQLLAFLKTLTDSSFVNNPKFQNPF